VDAAFNKKIRTFSVYSAALIIMALAAVYIPLFYIAAVILMPLPLALLVRRLDLWYSLAALLLTGVMLFMVTGRLQMAMLITLQTGPLGILLGLLFKNGVTAGRTLVVAISTSVAITGVTFLLMYLLTGSSPFSLDQVDRSMFHQMKQEIAALYAEGMDQDNIKELELVVDRIEALWPVLAASSSIIWIMVSTFFSYSVTRVSMARLGFHVPPADPFSRWRLPWYIIWGVIAGLALMLAGDETGAAGMTQAGKIILYVTGFILAVLGASVTTFYLKRWVSSRTARLLAVAVLVIFANIFTVVALVTLGLTDTILNIRRLSADGRTPEGEEKK